MTTNIKKEKRIRRKARIRAKVSGTAKRPRLAIFRSNRYLSAQLINDEKNVTLVAGTTAKMTKGTPTEKATILGAELAKDAKAKKITEVVFDRGGYIFAGQIKSLAEGARKAGLKF